MKKFFLYLMAIAASLCLVFQNVKAIEIHSKEFGITVEVTEEKYEFPWLSADPFVNMIINKKSFMEENPGDEENFKRFMNWVISSIKEKFPFSKRIEVMVEGISLFSKYPKVGGVLEEIGFTMSRHFSARDYRNGDIYVWFKKL